MSGKRTEGTSVRYDPHCTWQAMDIKTAVDVTRPKRIAKIMVDQDVHGRITAVPVREMAGLEGQATFENLDRTVLSHSQHVSVKEV